MSGLEWSRGALWPWLLLLPVVWALSWLVLDRARAAVRRYGVKPTTPVASPLWRSLFTTLLLGLGFVCWLDPRYGDEVVAVERRGLDVIFCVDTSQSMLARDLQPTRLERALRDVRAVLPELHGGDRAALVVFAGEARLWVPLTHDVDSFGGLLDEVDTEVVRTGGTDIAAALKKAREVADVDNAATTVVVLLTDGEDLAGEGAAAAARLAARGVPVHAFGLGDERGSKITVEGPDGETFLRDRAGREVISGLDARSLEAVAAAGGGEFVRLDGEPGGLAAHYATRILPQARRALADLDPPARALPAALLSLAFLAWILVLATRDARTR